MARVKLLLLLVVAAGFPLTAQQPAPAFEVASVKPTGSGPEGFLIAFRNGRYTARYLTLKRLIQSAYATAGGALRADQVIGGPAWLDVDRFDVEAIAPETADSSNGTIPPTVSLMLRQLLAERFSLRVHSETTERPLFALVLAREDGKLGPNLRRRTTPCISAPVGIAPRPDGVVCMGKTDLGLLMGTGLTMPLLATGLSMVIPDFNRMVVDRTGLAGTFDVELRWTPDTATTADRQGSTGLLTVRSQF